MDDRHTTGPDGEEARRTAHVPDVLEAARGELTVANGKLLRQLIRSGAEGDVDAFRGAAQEVIAEEREKQHHLLANDLETILYGRPHTPASPAVRKLTGDILEDRERGLPLLEAREWVFR